MEQIIHRSRLCCYRTFTSVPSTRSSSRARVDSFRPVAWITRVAWITERKIKSAPHAKQQTCSRASVSPGTSMPFTLGQDHAGQGPVCPISRPTESKWKSLQQARRHARQTGQEASGERTDASGREVLLHATGSTLPCNNRVYSRKVISSTFLRCSNVRWLSKPVRP